MNKLSGLLGLVLCGGESKRMGQDKGLITDGKNTWAEIAAAKLTALGLETLLSVNATQLGLYAELKEPFELVRDSLSIPGPLNGILSTHLLRPEMDLLVLACDLTEMSRSVLNLLLHTYRENPCREFYYFELGGQKEPLAAIYRKSALRSLVHDWESGLMKSFSLQKALSNERSFIIPWSDRAPFLNANTMENYRSARG